MSIQAATTLFAPRLLRDIRLIIGTTEHVWKLCKIYAGKPTPRFYELS